MTRAQFARAIAADEKWVENTARQLGRALRYTPAEARWLGLVRVLARDFGVPVARAGALARSALRHPPGTRSVRLAVTDDGTVALELDLARHHSTCSAAISAALHQMGPRRRGRPPARVRRHDPVAAAAAHGVDVTTLRENRRRSPAELLERLDEDAAFVSALRPTAPRARR